jgi:hypothetical protein
MLLLDPDVADLAPSDPALTVEIASTIGPRAERPHLRRAHQCAVPEG